MLYACSCAAAPSRRLSSSETVDTIKEESTKSVWAGARSWRSGCRTERWLCSATRGRWLISSMISIALCWYNAATRLGGLASILSLEHTTSFCCQIGPVRDACRPADCRRGGSPCAVATTFAKARERKKTAIMTSRARPSAFFRITFTQGHVCVGFAYAVISGDPHARANPQIRNLPAHAYDRACAIRLAVLAC
ncbi:hypothetical protein IWZ00DRAFT_103032 [Phyllosticta capitalensis]